eukprot:GEZU01000187.1.p1 GENE.GEZU01000187.1~~GEZU01000187.1.p1  ORF type:complete len:101 (-),score=10.24 GEZU01000187.1:61-363(-)
MTMTTIVESEDTSFASASPPPLTPTSASTFVTQNGDDIFNLMDCVVPSQEFLQPSPLRLEAAPITFTQSPKKKNKRETTTTTKGRHAIAHRHRDRSTHTG